MRRKIVAGNWKMNGDSAFIAKIIPALENVAVAESNAIVIAPPYPYLLSVSQAIGSNRLSLAAQDVACTENGAFTGAVSASMLADVGCSYCIVGHSERRALFGETDAYVALKIDRLHEVGIVPIVCVGETLEQRESGLTLSVVEQQVRLAVGHLSADMLSRVVLAYEPVWAIGTGKTASPQDAQEVHAHIRGVLASIAGDVAERISILYGGSVKSSNASELFSQKDVDGGLIGGASLDASDFSRICSLLS